MTKGDHDRWPLSGRLSARCLVSDVMDMVAACRAFVSVSDRGSFTIGAAAVGMQQSVASRRIAALEAHVGGTLFDRSTRHPRLTAFGAGLLAPARNLLAASDDLEVHARLTRSAVMRFALPEDSAPRRLAAFLAACRGAGVEADTVTAPPRRRLDLRAAGAVQAAVIPVDPENASWRVPLGVASARAEPAPFFVSSLRLRRSDAGRRRRLLVLAEDDVPQIRDPLVAHAESVGITPGQVAAAPSLPVAIAEVLAGDLLLCSRGQAEESQLFWRPLAGVAVARSFGLSSADPDLPSLLGPDVHDVLGDLLGAEQR